MTHTAIAHAGGPPWVRRLVVGMLAIAAATLPAAAVTRQEPDRPQHVQVRHDHGTYVVSARFDVSQTAEVARAVLSDYEEIPRFMPDVRTSVVVERTPRLLVEQEAVARFGLFSRTVHLVLEITHDEAGIDFVDRSGKSFSRYAGRWSFDRQEHGTAITYELSANPAFSVPEFLLKRLLTRDSRVMIGQLILEMATRG